MTKQPTGIIDTHLHIIDMGKLSYPWLAGFEPLRRDYPIKTYETEANRCGITAALHMEVDVAELDMEAETKMVEGLMDREHGLVIGAISSCRPENIDFPAMLERALQTKSVKGFRRVLHVMPDQLSTASLFRENIKRLSGMQLPFDLCVLPHQIPLAIALIDHAPDVQFILDHCGVPGIKDKVFEPWASQMTEIAKRPNVAVKISGVSIYGDAATWTIEDLRPFVEHAINIFGWNRCVWGGDWPVVTLGSSLSTWVAATHALIDGCSAPEKAALLSENAKRIWRL
jgi:predicted TIM-barrel fold metal-dependent hydrolase